MTVSSTTNRKEYAGNGVTTAFSTSPVVFFTSADLTVYVVSSAGVVTTLTENTHYTVSGGGTPPATGSVSLAGGSSPYGAPASGVTLVIVRDVAIVQETDFVQNDGSDADVAEAALDKLTIVSQQLDARIDRSFRLADSDATGLTLTLPDASAASRAARLIGLDGSGTGLELYDPASAVTVGTNVTFLNSGTAQADSIQGGLRHFKSALHYIPTTLHAAILAGTNTTDLSTYIANAIAEGQALFFPGANGVAVYKAQALTAISGLHWIGQGRPTIKAFTNGKHVIGGVSLSNVTIDGILFEGTGSTTVPTTTFTGGAATDTGLVTLNLCTDVRVTNCEAYNFYNGFCFIRTNRLWIEHNRVRNFKQFGIQVAESLNFTIERNVITDCDETGTTNCYGVHATGDSANSHASTANSISFNVIANVPAWDGIMTHEVFGLRIIGNDIRNVRNGIDVGAAGATPDIKDILIIGNYIKSTTTDTYSGSAASHKGILINGKNATYLVKNVVVANNIVDGFFSVTGITSSGDTADIVISYVDKAAVTGNAVVNSGSSLGHPGILVTGDTLSAIAVTGNMLDGTFSSGSIRFSAVTTTSASITGNSIKEGTTANLGIWISGSTISALAVAGNAMNNNAGSQFAISTSTVTFKSCDVFYSGSAVYDPANLVDGAGATTTVTVTGANTGDFAEASFSNDLQGITLTAWVSAANTVSVRFQNESGGALDLASGTLRARVRMAQ